MESNELNEIIRNHSHWLKQDVEGWENMRADLRGANLRGANLREADLRGANLRRVDLREADLRGADLRGAGLSETDLCRANLSEADLRRADLCMAFLGGTDLCAANLRGVNLCMANLRGADLSGADLREAKLCGINLHGADLRRADLSEADLREANLNEANLSGAQVPFIPYACPDFGAFIGYKKARVADRRVIVVLEIPQAAKRLSATGRKCRCNKAKVMEIQNLDGTKADETIAYSYYDSSFEYKLGETITVDNFCEDRWNECSPGIHFFINRQEAVEYCY